MTQREIERSLARYGGLIHETARQIIANGAEIEREDLMQLLAIKVWQGLTRWDPERLPLDRFVFGILYNLRKDIEKRPRRHNVSMEEEREREHWEPASGTVGATRADRFDARYLSIDAERVYFEVEDEAVVLPSTLTRVERRFIRLRLKGRRLLEIDAEMGLSRTQRERVMSSVREKLADWAPTRPEPRHAPTPPLPGAEVTRARIAA